MAAIVATAGSVCAAGVATQQRDVFRTSLDVVQLDISATNQDGQPVTDLSADDLEIFEDSRRVEVVSFEAVRLPAQAVRSRALAAEASPGVVWATNDRAEDGRLVVVVLDHVERARFHRARQTVVALLEHLAPGDQVAMLANGGTRPYQVEFTRDPSRVARALDARTFFTGNRGELLPMLTRLAEALRPVAGRRKIVVLVSEGIPEIAGSLNILQENKVPELRDFLTAAQQANVTVYAFNPRYALNIDEMIRAEDVEARAGQVQQERDGIFGLQTVAEATGGWAAVRTNTFEAGVARMFAENASYYLVAYRSNAPSDGRYHHIVVRCRRAGVEVRTRSGYRSPKSPSSAAPIVAPVDRLAAAPVQAGGLPLRIVAVAVPSKSGRTNTVHVVAEVSDAALASAEGLQVKALGVDLTGRVRATDQFAGRLRGGLPHEGTRWLRVALSLDLAPGRYQLRVAAARSDGGATGSVFDEIEVPDFRKDLALGGLVLGTPGASGVARADHLMSDLGFVPVATRELPRMPVRAGLPLRVSPEHRSTTVGFLATLSCPDGTTREIMRDERPATTFVDGGMFSFDVPLEGLPAGDYRVLVDVSLARRSAHRETSFRLLPRPD